VRRNTNVRRITLAALSAAALLLAAACGALVLAAACGGGGETTTRVESKDLSLEARLDPAAPRTGENRMLLRVLGPDGKPVSGADLDVKVVMPAMGAMPAMGGPARIEPLGEGRFQADFKLDMAGTYRVDVRARAGDGKALEAEGSLITGQSGLRLAPRGGGGAPGAEPTGGAAHAGEVVVDPARRQKIGVRTAAVQREPFAVTIRAMGLVGYDQGAIHDVAPRVMGYVGNVQVPATGNTVTQGDLLFTLFSPDLVAAQKELLTARASQRGPAAGTLARAAEERLRRWGMSPGDIDRVVRTGAPLEYVPFRAPVSGVVVEKNVVDGSGTQAGERLFRIASVDRVWIEAELYEADLALVRPGAPARISVPYLPGERFEGTVSLITPFLDGDTRTARARIEIANPGHALLPGMYATVEMRRELGERLVVPASAVLYAGSRRFVFIDAGAGRLRPQAVETGLRDGERLEVLSGLEAGQIIVISGNYLIASESRLGSALEQW
jgi:Cu(I)/Ag(I) efflux system membrane fusion protein